MVVYIMCHVTVSATALRLTDKNDLAPLGKVAFHFSKRHPLNVIRVSVG